MGGRASRDEGQTCVECGMMVMICGCREVRSYRSKLEFLPKLELLGSCARRDLTPGANSINGGKGGVGGCAAKSMRVQEENKQTTEPNLKVIQGNFMKLPMKTREMPDAS